MFKIFTENFQAKARLIESYLKLKILNASLNLFEFFRLSPIQTGRSSFSFGNFYEKGESVIFEREMEITH